MLGGNKLHRINSRMKLNNNHSKRGIRWVQEGKSIYSETERGDITEFSEKGDICWVILVYITHIDNLSDMPVTCVNKHVDEVG